MENLIKFIILLPVYLVAKLIQYAAYVCILVIIGVVYKVCAGDMFMRGLCIFAFIVIGLLTFAGFCKKQ